MRKNPRHLFLRLYKYDFKGFEKPLTAYIKDYDKKRPIVYYEHNKTNRSLQTEQDSVRNLDHLYLFEPALINILFVTKYLMYLQKNDIYEDVELQDLFELSLLMDSDKKPNTDAFNHAYISDSRRDEIQIYEKYYRLLLWVSMSVSDLEFHRRIMETLINSVPSNKDFFKLDDNYTFDSPFINYEKSSEILSVDSVSVSRHDEYITKMKSLENKFLEDLNTPENVLFDGDRINILVKDSPISLMFSLNKTDDGTIDDGKSKFKYTIEDINKSKIKITHPTNLQPAFINRRLSEHNGSWWNGRTSWDYTWQSYIESAANELENGTGIECIKETINKLREISFITLLKNNGTVQYKDGREPKKVSDIVNKYIDERLAIKQTYGDVVDSMISMASQYLFAYRNREVAIYYKSKNGYIVSFYKPYRRSVSKKLDSRAEYYDNDFNKIGVSEFYTDKIFTEKEKKDIYGGRIGGTDKHVDSKGKVKTYNKEKRERLRKYITNETFKDIFSKGSPIAIDYHNPDKDITSSYLKKLKTLTENNDGTQSFNNLTYPMNTFINRLNNIFAHNSLNTYSKYLHNSIKVNGYANIKNYNKVVKYISENKIETLYTPSEDYELNDNFGAVSRHTNPREKVIYKVKRGKIIDTEEHSAFDFHIEFGDVEYVRGNSNNNRSIKDFLDNIKEKEYNPNHRKERKEKRNTEQYKHKTLPKN